MEKPLKKQSKKKNPHGRLNSPLIVTLMKLIKVGKQLPKAG